MAFPGYGAAIAILMSWIDKFVPSKKAALVDELNKLNEQYAQALARGDDTFAATLRKQMAELRKKAGFAEGEL